MKLPDVIAKYPALLGHEKGLGVVVESGRVVNVVGEVDGVVPVAVDKVVVVKVNVVVGGKVDGVVDGKVDAVVGGKVDAFVVPAIIKSTGFL